MKFKPQNLLYLLIVIPFLPVLFIFIALFSSGSGVDILETIGLNLDVFQKQNKK